MLNKYFTNKPNRRVCLRLIRASLLIETLNMFEYILDDIGVLLHCKFQSVKMKNVESLFKTKHKSIKPYIQVYETAYNLSKIQILSL